MKLHLSRLAAGEPVLQGASINHEDARRDFTGSGCYPIALAEASLSVNAIARYARWQQWMDWDFEASGSPWLPVGAVGPLLVLGHFNPREVVPPLPVGAFQPVLITRADYERHLQLCAPQIRAQGHIDWSSGEIVRPRATLASNWIRPTSVASAIEWMMQYCPHGHAEYEQLRALRSKGLDIPEAELPAGYLGAAYKLLQRHSVVDLSAVKISDGLRARVPAELAGVIYPVSESGTDLWVASSRLPQPGARDILLNNLGDGWHVHFVFLDSAREVSQSSNFSSGASSDSKKNSSKIVIESRLVARDDKGSGGFIDNESGVIVISQKEKEELLKYDPRRSDREPKKVFRKFLVQSLESGASDLHVEPGVDQVKVRGRVDGLLEEWLDAPLDFGIGMIGAGSVMLGLKKEKFQPEDISAKIILCGAEVKVRVSAFPIRASERKLVLRFLPKKGAVPLLKDVLPERAERYAMRALQAPQGMILLCGPTGSGKTTTIAACIQEVNTPDSNIVTLEDPIEYEIPGVNQAEIDEARGVSWGELNRSILRQDPDAGLIGEIRDQETAVAATRLALTGHLVFATLHTNSCAETIERLIDVGINVNMLAEALMLVISQRLLRKVCKKPGCSHVYDTTDEQRAVYVAHGLPVPKQLWKASGAASCNCRGGYKGRAAAVEILPITEEVRDLVAVRSRARVFRAWMKSMELYTVHEAALTLAARGITTFEEANQWQSVWEVFPELLPKTPAQTSDGTQLSERTSNE